MEQMSKQECTPRLTAVNLTDDDGGFEFRPAPIARSWMSETRDGFARRCLPMLIANQAGWEILNPADTVVEWDGTEGLEGLRVSGDAPPRSHFGHGIVTWTLPFLLRTSPGFNLLVRGPANRPKDGVAALEGIVETDWSTATFTINWILTRPGTVRFAKGEPIAVLMPSRRGEIETFDVAIKPFDHTSSLLADYQEWRRQRESFLANLAEDGGSSERERWQGDYFRGTLGGPAEGAGHHQTRLRLRSFHQLPPSDEQASRPSPTVAQDRVGDSLDRKAER